MRRWIFGLSAVVTTTALVMACSVGTDCDFGLCAGPTAGVDGGGSEGGADSEGGVKPPDGCDATKEPKDSPKCVSSDFGIFVSPNGTAGGTGKMDSPVNTDHSSVLLVVGREECGDRIGGRAKFGEAA